MIFVTTVEDHYIFVGTIGDRHTVTGESLQARAESIHAIDSGVLPLLMEP